MRALIILLYYGVALLRERSIYGPPHMQPRFRRWGVYLTQSELAVPPSTLPAGLPARSGRRCARRSRGRSAAPASGSTPCGGASAPAVHRAVLRSRLPALGEFLALSEEVRPWLTTITPPNNRFNGRTYKPHPVADCFPLMTGSAFRDLVDDLRHNGMTQPVLVLGDYILDGRNRLLAAFEAGLTMIPVKELPHNTDAVALGTSLNIHRRHMTASQCACACASLLDLSQRAYRANHPDVDLPDSGSADASDPAGDAEPIDPALRRALDSSGVVSARLLAKEAGLSPTSVVAAQRLRRSASDLFEAVYHGAITLNDAQHIQFEPEDVRRQAVDDVRAGEASSAVRAIRKRYQREPVSDPDAGPSPSDAQPAPVPPDMPPGEIAVPSALIGFVRTLLGEITLDPCSASWCAGHVGAAELYGADRDGLLQDWNGRVWVFPPPDRAEPFLVKLLGEFDAEHIEAAAALVPMTPWADATLEALGSPYFRGLAVPRRPLGCRRPNGSVVCPPEPLWLLLFGALTAPPVDVLGAFAATVLIPQVGSSH